MAIEYTMRALCDGCKRTIEDKVEVNFSDIMTTRWKWERRWHGDGVLIRRRFKGTTIIMCKNCADGPPKRK